MKDIARFLLEQYMIDVSVFEDTFFRRTAQSRMNLLFCKSEKDYLNFLRTSPSEVALMTGSLTNSYSEFFRNPLTFAMLQQVVLPMLYSRRAPLDISELRIWSAGCAAGQEPYSLAMTIQDFVEEHHLTAAFRIFATDISSEQIKVAQKGEYEVHALQTVSIGMFNRYFTKAEHTYRVVDKIRKTIDFTRWDLLDPETMVPPSSIFGGFDLILCCNVLFYYSPSVQRQAINKLTCALNDGGVLVTGEAEMALFKRDHRFRQLVAMAPIFNKL